MLHKLRSKPTKEMDHFILDVMILSEAAVSCDCYWGLLVFKLGLITGTEAASCKVH